MLRFLTYSLTLALAMLFGYWELQLKRRLADNAFRPNTRPSEFGVTNDLSEKMERERTIAALPKAALKPYRTVVTIKFLLLAILIVEVIVLQGSR